MNPKSEGPAHIEAAWAAIERDKQRDRLVRRVCVGAWGVTLLTLLAYAVVVGIEVGHQIRLTLVGMVPLEVVLRAFIPLLLVVGALALLVATLSTVGIFLRLRTASLAQIQLRLAALEEILARRDEA
jgi:hypothetical protein